MNTSDVNWLDQKEKDKKIKQGPCIFPFKHEGKMHNACIKTSRGSICATKVTPKRRTLKTFGYCPKTKKKKTLKVPKKFKKVKVKVMTKKNRKIEEKKVLDANVKHTKHTTTTMSKARKVIKVKGKKKKVVMKTKKASLNEQFINLLEELEDLMKMKGEGFRARAYHTAAETIMAYPTEIKNPDELKGQPGIGDTILKKFKEFMETGTLRAIEKEKMSEHKARYLFVKVYGIGPKKALQLAELGLTSIAQLRERQDELLNAVQKKGLRHYEDILKRIPRAEVVEYEKVFKKVFDKVKQDGDEFEILGSYRRGNKTSGDIDVAVTNKQGDDAIFKKFLDELEKEGVLVESLSKGKTKILTVGKLPGSTTARRLDFMYSKPEEYSFAVLYFTGSKAFNVVQRQRAVDLGYTMNEHGLFKLTGPKKNKKGERVKGDFPTEKSIFDFLGLEYKKPTERKSGKAVILKTGEQVKTPVDEMNTPSPIVMSPTKNIKKSTKKKSLKKAKVVKKKKGTIKIKANRKVKKKDTDSKLRTNWELLTNEGISVVKQFSEETICEMVRVASAAYYNKQPFVADNVFDILKEYGQRTYPNNPCFDEVGAPTDKAKVKLPFEMHSMDKIKPDTNALPKYKAKYPGPKVISGKLDGISVLYSGGKLYTRGRSTHGMDISYMVPYLDLPKRKDVTLRGELLIKEKLFEKKYSAEYKNSRNMVAGLVNAKKRDTSKWTDLDFVGYEVIEPAMKPSEQLAWLQKNGVVTVLHEVTDDISNEMLSDLLVEWRSNYEYMIDGIIVNDDKQHPRRNKNPDYAFAFKMVLSDQIAEVKVVDVIWTASKDAYLNPVVQVEPVNIRGATIEFVTAHNAKYVEDNNIGVGSVIQLIRSGDVIPKIQAVIQPAESPKMPSVPWVWNESHVDAMLKNTENNPMVLQKNVEFFFKKLDIKGVGPGNVKRLIKAGFNTVPKILLMTKEELLTVEGFKEKTVVKIKGNMDEAIRNASLVMIASASNVFGRGLGSSILRNIIHEYPNIFESSEQPDTKIDQVAAVENVGKKRAKLFVKNLPNFISFLTDAGLTNKLNEQVGQNIDKSHPLYGKRIVMTGFRDKPLKKTLVDLGAKISTSVSKSTFVVLVKDLEEDTSKAEEAREEGVSVELVDTFRKKYKL